MKVGVGIADIMCGMYAAVAILAALRHRDATGLGQTIDAALLDTQVAWLVNEGTNFLLSGQVPPRQGTEHPNIVPYKTFASADGYVILAVGNDAQFQKWCRFAGAAELAADPRFATNSLRVGQPAGAVRADAGLHARQDHGGVGRGPRGARRALRAGEHPGPGVRRPAGAGARHAARPAAPQRRRRDRCPLVANPLKMSLTPPDYRHSPPTLGQHTDEVLERAAGAGRRPSAPQLRAAGTIG